MYLRCRPLFPRPTARLVASRTGEALPIHCVRRQLATRAVPKGSDGPATKKETMRALDSLLGSSSDEGDDAGTSIDKRDLVPWWSAVPRQAAPPRQTAMGAGGGPGRFLLNEDLLGELRTGNVTEVGGDLRLPRSTPVASWATLVLCVVVFGTYSNVVAYQGPASGQDFLSDVALDHSVPGLQMWNLFLPLLAHSSGLQLMASMWGLATVAPEAEALLGYGTYMAIFLLSGLAGEVVSLAVDPAGTSCGPAACLAGLAAALAVLQTSSSAFVQTATKIAAVPASTIAQDLAEFAAAAGIQSGLAVGSDSPVSSSSSTPAQVEPDSNVGSSPTSSSEPGVPQPKANAPLILAFHAAGSLGLAVLASQQQQQLEQQLPVIQQLHPAALMVGALTGALLARLMGPCYQVSREPDIPVGSMVIPQDARERIVVCDTRSTLERGLVAAAFSVALLIAL